MSSSVSSPSFVFFSERESSIPTRHTDVETSIVAITSGLKPGGVSTMTTSLIVRSDAYTSLRYSIETALA